MFDTELKVKYTWIGLTILKALTIQRNKELEYLGKNALSSDTFP